MNPLTQLETFDPVSLAELDAKADMLTRLDNKYIVREAISVAGIKKLREAFDVLKIENRTSFGYHTIYFDSKNLCFTEYTHGKRQRFKARTRVYQDSKNLAFFEVKLSGKGQTDKFRVRCDVSQHGVLSSDFLKFLKEKYHRQYKKAFPYRLTPSVSTSYTRVTLVAKDGGERLTIDYNLVFVVDGKKLVMPSNFAIFETKSKNGNGLADKILRFEQLKAVDGCSKFGLAMVLSGKVSKYNKFLPVIKKHFKTFYPTLSLQS
jgi:hypothetical protein